MGIRVNSRDSGFEWGGVRLGTLGGVEQVAGCENLSQVSTISYLALIFLTLKYSEILESKSKVEGIRG